MYSTNEAAEKLGMSQDHVRLLARTGVIEAKKLGHDWVVLNLDYKRKRRLKRTSYVSLTPSGRQAIITLGQQGRDGEAEILRFLISGGATVQQISDETHVQPSKIHLYLRQFKKENWIKEKRVEEETLGEESPEEDKPKEETLEEGSLEEDKPKEETLEETSFEEDKPEEKTLEETSFEEDKPEEKTLEETSFGEDKPEEKTLEETSFGEDKPEEKTLEEEEPEGISLVYDF